MLVAMQNYELRGRFTLRLNAVQLDAVEFQIMSWLGCLHWGKAAAAFAALIKLLAGQ